MGLQIVFACEVPIAEGILNRTVYPTNPVMLVLQNERILPIGRSVTPSLKTVR
jgi:hypothetical protein